MSRALFCKLKNMFNDFLLQTDQLTGNYVSVDELWQKPVLTQLRRNDVLRDTTNPVHVQSWILQKLESVIDQQSIEKVCANCKRRYTEWTNIGRLFCRYHSGSFLAGRYTCCGGLTPCQSCDHRTTAGSWPEQELQIAVPTHLLPLLRPQKMLEPVYENPNDPARSYVWVLRASHPTRSYQTKPLKI